MREDDEPIVVEQTYNTPIDVVWRAITEIDQMRQWYFENIPSFEPVVGFETQFDVQCEDRHFLHMWKITEVEPLKMIAYDWRYEGYPGDSFVMFELFQQEDVTKLRLTHQTTKSFPKDIPEFERESGVEGWTFFIQKSLKEFVERNKSSSA